MKELKQKYEKATNHISILQSEKGKLQEECEEKIKNEKQLQSGLALLEEKCNKLQESVRKIIEIPFSFHSLC